MRDRYIDRWINVNGESASARERATEKENEEKRRYLINRHRSKRTKGERRPSLATHHHWWSKNNSRRRRRKRSKVLVRDADIDRIPQRTTCMKILACWSIERIHVRACFADSEATVTGISQSVIANIEERLARKLWHLLWIKRQDWTDFILHSTDGIKRAWETRWNVNRIELPVQLLRLIHSLPLWHFVAVFSLCYCLLTLTLDEQLPSFIDVRIFSFSLSLSLSLCRSLLHYSHSRHKYTSVCVYMFAVLFWFNQVSQLLCAGLLGELLECHFHRIVARSIWQADTHIHKLLWLLKLNTCLCWPGRSRTHVKYGAKITWVDLNEVLIG